MYKITSEQYVLHGIYLPIICDSITLYIDFSIIYMKLVIAPQTLKKESKYIFVSEHRN